MKSVTLPRKLFLTVLAVGRKMSPSLHRLFMYYPGMHKYDTLHGKRVFVDVIEVVDLEMGRLAWIIQVGPV